MENDTRRWNMKAKPVVEKDIDEILSGIKALLMSAMEEGRSIQFEMNRPFFEKPSSGSIQEYETTGQIFIEIKDWIERIG